MLIGSFCQERTFAVADGNDRLWSGAAFDDRQLTVAIAN
jgi:hypothetical protein